MAITNEQAEKIKNALLAQIEKFPEENRTQIKKQIQEMTIEEIEEFVKKNNLEHLDQECIFCSIADKKIPSIEIQENNEAIAILDINPVSKAHTLVISKKHESDYEAIEKLAKEVQEKIKKTFNPKEIQTIKLETTEHPVIQIIPIYEDTDINKRKKAKQEELKKIKDALGNKKKPEKLEHKEPLKQEKKEIEHKEEKALPSFKARIPK